MNQMLRFRNVDVSNAGPFASEQSLYFSEGLTLVAGGNGTGKTTIAKTLRREYESTNRLTPEREIAEIPSWLIFFDDDVRTPYGGAPWAPLALLMSSHREFFTRRSDFDSDLTMNVRKLLGTKLETRYSKFSTRVTSPDQLHVTLNDDGAVVLTVNDGEHVIDCFQAMGERLALFLSINAAVRKLLFFDVPFVVDSQLGFLDQSLLRSCYQFIPGVGKQTIVLESSLIVEMLGLRPHFQIVYDPRLERSTIEEIA